MNKIMLDMAIHGCIIGANINSNEGKRLMVNDLSRKIDYGLANGWKETPEQIRKCLSKKHQKRERIIGKCLHEVWCPLCGYSYKYDSGD